MTCRTSTLLRLVADAYEDFELYFEWPNWGTAWPGNGKWMEGHTLRYPAADDALLAALEHHWANQ